MKTWTQMLKLRKINQLIVGFLGKTPPKKIPKELFDRYTLNNKIKTSELYFNEVGLFFMPGIFFRFKKWFKLAEIQKKEGKDIDKWMFKAIEKYPIKDKYVVNIGAGGPYHECVCLSLGAKQTTTIEYNKLIFLHPKMKTMTPKEYDKNPVKFDAGFALSSFEHDGLGRYGDPLNPEADLQIMQKMKKMIKKGGILYLVIPIGKDLVVWNAHRVYGKIRLPLLLKGWEILDSFGFKKSKLDVDNKDAKYQAVFVLKNI